MDDALEEILATLRRADRKQIEARSARKTPQNETLFVRPVDQKTMDYVYEQLNNYKLKFPERVEALDKKITEYCKSNIETSEDVDLKEKVRDKLEELAKKAFNDWGGLWMIGSTAQNLCVKGGDLDLYFISLEHFPHISISLLQAELDKRKSGIIRSVQFISSTTDPFVKVRLRKEYNFTVDINCSRPDSVLTAHLIYHYVMFDSRVRPLIVALKNWLLKAGILDPLHGKLNSVSIALMAIHYLQSVCSPAILPNLSELCPELVENVHLSRNHDLCMSEELKSKMERNDQTVGELFLGFLVYYAHYNTQYAISVRLGERHEKVVCVKDDNNLVIEEPVERRDLFTPNIMALFCEIKLKLQKIERQILEEHSVHPADLVDDTV